MEGHPSLTPPKKLRNFCPSPKMLNKNTNISKIMTRHVKIVNSDTNTSNLVMRHV